MSQLLVRKLLIDLETPFPLRWNGGEAFSSAFMNALSMSFPVGEQFFMDSLRRGLNQLPAAQQDHHAPIVKLFAAQEATHRHLHALFNKHLDKHGQVNHWAHRAQKRIARIEKLDARHGVAATAATEHFTAVLAHWLLSHPDLLAQAEPRIRTMWMWHASEESEHRSIAFDVYLAMGGNLKWRLRWMRLMTLFLWTDLLRQTVNNLWHDRSLFKLATWRSGWRFLLGPQGLVTTSYAHWRAYFRTDFHPSQSPDALSREWLQAHENDYTRLGQSA